MISLTWYQIANDLPVLVKLLLGLLPLFILQSFELHNEGPDIARPRVARVSHVEVFTVSL